MFEGILAAVSKIVLDTIESWGYLGILFLMALESANIPIPSEIIMPFSGFLVATGKFNFWLVVLMGALGNLLGSIVNYFLAYHYGKKAALFLSKLAFVEMDDFDIAETWFKKFGLLSSFFARLVPIIRTFISFPAGMFRVNLMAFSLLTFAGSFFWSLVLTSAGYLTGENWGFLEPYFRRFDVIIGAVILAIVFWLVYRRFGKKVLK